MSAKTKASMHGRGLYFCADARASVFEALEPLRCEGCGRPISGGETFTRIHLTDVACGACRPFETLLEDRGDPPAWAEGYAQELYSVARDAICDPEISDEEIAAAAVRLIHLGREAFALGAAAEERLRRLRKEAGP